MRGHVRLGLLTLAVFLTVQTVAYAQASITGVVRDTSGAVLPGVTVEATSPVLIEKVRSVVSDGTGQYRIENLRPGAYAVTFALPGFATVKREGIELTGTFVATVNAELRVGSLEETVTVTGDTPVVDVQSTVRQRVLDEEVLELVPANRTAAFMASLMSGVSRTRHDVGGITGDGSAAGDLIVRGVTGDAREVIGGVPNHTGGGGPHGAYNLGAYQEVAVDTGSLGVDQSEAGVRMNLIPRDGGNSFSGSSFIAFANDSMQGTNFTQELKDRGLSTPDSVKQLLDLNPTFGGPIRQNRLWFHSTARYTRAWNYAAIFYNKNAGDANAWTYEPDLSRDPASNENTIQHFNGRVTWQATAKNKVAVTYDVSDVCDCPRNLTATSSPEGAIGNWVFYSPPKSQIWTEWTAPMTNRLLLEATAYRHWTNFTRAADNVFFPSSPPVKLIGVVEQSTGLRYRATPSVNDLVTDTFYTRGTVSYITGAHALKVGFSGGWANNETTQRSVDAPMEFRFNNGVPNRVTLHATPHRGITKMDADHGLFIEERWTVNRLTLTGGLRYSYFKLSFPEQRVGPTEFTPNRNLVFPDTAGVTWHDIMPRAGAALDLFGDSKTALKISLGKYMRGQAVSGSVFSNAAPVNRLVVSTNRSWTDANRNFSPDCDLVNPAGNGECGPMDNLNFGSAVPALVFDPDVVDGWGKRSNLWQFATGVQREILPRLSLQVDYWRTWFGNFIVTQNRSYGPDDFDQFSVTAPVDPRLPGGGGYVISGLVDTKPELFGRPYDGLVTFADNFGKQTDHWNGVDVTVSARPRPGVLLQGGTSTQRQTTDNCEVVSRAAGEPPLRGTGLPAYNPSQLYCHVEGTFLSQIKLMGSYTVPRIDVQVTASLQSLPGPEIVASYVASNAVVRPSLGRNLAGGLTNVTVNLIEPRTLYGERLNQLDLRIGKILQMGPMRATASFDLYNAFNSSAVLTLSNAFGTWQQPQSIVNARFAKVGLQLDF
jgi:hypothetical protein